MATPKQIRDAVDTRLAALWPKLLNKQQQFAARTGRYWQGIRTPGTTPGDGTEGDVEPTKHPHYQPETWADLLGVDLPSKLDFSLEVTQYATPTGEIGFVATVEVSLGGQTWRRSKGYGPEDRDSQWAHLQEPLG